MRATTSPQPPATVPQATACEHCDHERVVATLADFVGFQRRHPVRGFGSVLSSLRSMYPLDTLLAMCPGCGCLTADLGPHGD